MSVETPPPPTTNGPLGEIVFLIQYVSVVSFISLHA